MAVMTDVRVERFDLSVYDLPTVLPGLVSINFDPPASGPEYELTFASAPNCDPPSEDFIRSEVEQMTGRSVLAIRQRSERPGEDLEPREPESRWDDPVVVIACVFAFWTIALAVIFGVLAVFL